MTHTCVSRLTITGSDNGLSPGQRQAIIWTNAGILLIGLLGTNFSEKLIEILTFSFTKMRLKVSSAKWRPFCRPQCVNLYQRFKRAGQVVCAYEWSLLVHLQINCACCLRCLEVIHCETRVVTCYIKVNKLHTWISAICHFEWWIHQPVIQ